MKNITLCKTITCALLISFSQILCVDSIVCPPFGEIADATGHKINALQILLGDLKMQSHDVIDKIMAL